MWVAFGSSKKMENKCSQVSSEVIKRQLGFHNGFFVPTIGRKGGLALFWATTTHVELVSYFNNHIHVRISMHDN